MICIEGDTPPLNLTGIPNTPWQRWMFSAQPRTAGTSLRGTAGFTNGVTANGMLRQLEAGGLDRAEGAGGTTLFAGAHGIS